MRRVGWWDLHIDQSQHSCIHSRQNVSLPAIGFIQMCLWFFVKFYFSKPWNKRKAMYIKQVRYFYAHVFSWSSALIASVSNTSYSLEGSIWSKMVPVCSVESCLTFSRIMSIWSCIFYGVVLLFFFKLLHFSPNVYQRDCAFAEYLRRNQSGPNWNCQN